jgi:GTP-binding nuclear protein Ran
MFDVSDPQTYENVPNWHRGLINACGEIPIVLAGNKINNKDRKVMADNIMVLQNNDFQVIYGLISLKRLFSITIYRL